MGHLGNLEVLRSLRGDKMIRNFWIKCLIVTLVLPAAAVRGELISTVTIGSPGNAVDDTSYGGVDYTYNIGKYEVTAGQYTQFLNAVAKTDTYSLYNSNMSSSSYGCKIQQTGVSGSFGYSVADEYKDRPVNYTSWGDAARFSNWLHNGQPTGAQDLTTTEDGAYYLNGASSITALMAVSRETDWEWAIPTEDEWYKAAYSKAEGTGYYDYPTGSDTTPGYIDNSGNFSGTSISFTEGGVDPGGIATYDGDGTPWGIDSPYYMTEVGEHENSASPFGTYDQGGNVAEWNETMKTTTRRGSRGGEFKQAGWKLTSGAGGIDAPAWEGNRVGFRVASSGASSAAIPEPGSIGLAALVASLGIGWHHRHRKRAAKRLDTSPPRPVQP